MFELCKADCKECNGINVTPVGEEDLYFCKNTDKILIKIDDATLIDLDGYVDSFEKNNI